MENGGQIKSWGAHGGGVFSVEFCRDGRLVSSGAIAVTKLWDGNGGALKDFEAFNDLALQATHCDETNRVIAGDWTGEIRVWNAADGTRIGQLTTNPPTLEARLAAAQAQVAPAAESLLPQRLNGMLPQRHKQLRRRRLMRQLLPTQGLRRNMLISRLSSRRKSKNWLPNS